MAQKTYSAKPSDVARKWYVVDASEVTLGRLATQVAVLLTGKSKPQFTKHIDTGDFVIVIKIYAGAEHKHEAQQPEAFSLVNKKGNK
jgi:large subunit ribosomal protein L13